MKERLLRVTCDVFTAGAVFEKDFAGWKLQRCAPILNWMHGKTPAEIADTLKRKRLNWQWLP